MEPITNSRKALIVGATGLTGGYCVESLLENPNYSEVIAIGRKPLSRSHQKLKTVVTTFGHLERDLHDIEVDDVFCCLGTTMNKAGSREAFKKVDFSLVLKVAEVMRRQGAQQFLVISSLGADIQSKIFYNRVKGEMEQAVQELRYPSLHILRPSLLLGPREEFRLGEQLAVLLTPLLNLLLIGPLKKYRPVQAKSVARFMVKAALEKTDTGVHIYESEVMR